MSDRSTQPAEHRLRLTEDPWVIVHRVIHDLNRDGIRISATDDALPALLQLAVGMLAALGVTPLVPDDGAGG